jgi:hypothetical protein
MGLGHSGLEADWRPMSDVAGGRRMIVEKRRRSK